ncbi:LytR C-terminal domain-containing protein [Streptomyces meridianus]|uniref:LytR C-terminal domain-containing protein n=1 Tax=Streptomyces meridianus TaxID=2938945 RepID=A0ABT0XEH4_9ACTN|nr:LytR C-terminal domain-containing protein [Streptomyces meridianus]MCM2580172.1 LytR C-terminal domain-containing protein [Streptomyces meridianus]
MSMLTPPGMGGKYRITGDRYPRMRRPRNRRRIMVAALGAVTALALLGWGTVQLVDVFTGGGKASAAGRKADCKPRPAATVSPVALPKPSAITVNVYNATPRSGLAKKTADELKKRGFKIGKIGNAPAEYDKKVKASGLLLGAEAEAEDPRFRMLGLQLAGAAVKSDDRRGKDVDLIIGSGFKKLVSQKDVDRAVDALAHPAPSPKASAAC